MKKGENPMLQFVAKVTSFNQDTETEEKENLLLSADSFEEAMRHIEGWFAEDLITVELTCVSNKSWFIVSDEIAKFILTDPKNREFW